MTYVCHCHMLSLSSAGYIGSHFTLLLLDQPKSTRYNIVLIDDLSRGDIRNIERLKKLCPEWHTLYFYKVSRGCCNVHVTCHCIGNAVAVVCMYVWMRLFKLQQHYMNMTSASCTYESISNISIRLMLVILHYLQKL